MKSEIAVALAASLTCAGAAYAGGEKHQDMSALDTNQDSYISVEEANQVPDLVARWDELDANLDGQLDQEEFARFETEEGAETPAEAPKTE